MASWTSVTSKTRLGLIGLVALISLWPLAIDAQIKIGGNVYGGGNHAEVRGSTKVTVRAGDIGAVMNPNATRPLADPQGRVFGGARMANVRGSSYVHIDGENFSDANSASNPDYIVVNQVFGGNDIAGTIGTAAAVGETIPADLTAVKRTSEDAKNYKKNVVNETFNSYVRISTKTAYTAEDIAAAQEGDPAYGKSAGFVDHYTEEEIAAASSNPDNPAYGKTTSDIKPPANAKKVYIGQLFGGGNGDYYYDQSTAAGKTTHNIYSKDPSKGGVLIESLITDEGEVGFQLPELNKTYLEIKGGSIVYGYGGGNNATVKEQAIIHFDNPSAVVNHILVNETTGEEANAATYTAYDEFLAGGTHTIDEPFVKGKTYTNLLSTNRFKEMGINTTFSKPSSGAYQVGRFFGGNNKATMAIRPTWNLLAGKIRNLYSGGNKGNMTSPEGLLLEIKDYSTLIVDNLYGGCRMADVMPTANGIYTPCTNLEGYYFPDELSARVMVEGGHVHNVYGGNDVTGTVYGGNAVGIKTTVYGDVYGGGNGAYPYTDLINEESEDWETYGDFHYDAAGSSENSLNAFRPNAEQVSLHLWGESLKNPTIVHGSIFVGGNCASLAAKKDKPLVELKIGSHVIADNVYLGNNGEDMINQTYLEKYADDNHSTLNLTTSATFSKYMDGVAMTLMPNIVFESRANGDRYDYEDYSSYIGSFYFGGNVGSMAIPGKMVFNVNRGLNIYNKLVGGCNNADVPVIKNEKGEDLNATYQGGLIGSEDERESYTDENGIKDRLEINMDNLTIVPLRWNADQTQLIWNTNKWADYALIEEGTVLAVDDEYYTYDSGTKEYIKHTVEDESYTVTAEDKYYEPYGGFVEIANNAVDKDTRLLGGNIYGGCYNSGHVNGNLTININEDVLKREEVFGNGVGLYGRPASRVDLDEQREDLMAVALTVFGGGYGKDTEIWGSTTVNHNNGYVFQIFGGGEQGVVGKKNTEGDYVFNPAYSTTVNLNGTATVYSNEDNVENLAETEYIYGGGNEGDVCGNTLVNLGNGRLYDAFGGASDADILGHTEVYIGRQPKDGGGYKEGFPWIMDIVYGGNDFGGTIHGAYEDGYNFEARLRDYATDKTQLHGYETGEIPDVLKSSSYVEYLTGRVDTIFGGGYGSYDYSNTALYGSTAKMPEQHSSFVNFRPNNHAQNSVDAIYGGGTGYPGNRENDKAQDRSYVLVDIPDGTTKFNNLEVFGGGSYNGLGMGVDKDKLANGTIKLDEASAIIDLLRGRIHNAYGGSYQEGVTRRTVVNVPAESSIQVDSIYGGAYGKYILPPCDVYETQVNYKNTSEKAQVFGAIFGGNNNERRSLFTQVNISSPVWQNKEKGLTGTVYGAGRGIDTWSEHTEVNLLKGARIYQAYGGGEMGHVLNSASVQAYMKLYENDLSEQISGQDPFWSSGGKYTIVDGKRIPATDALKDRWKSDWHDAWTLGDYYVPGVSNGETEGAAFTKYATNTATSLAHFSNRAELDDKTAAQLNGEKKFNTNVIVNEGAVVDGYIYGGGLGDASVYLSGDVYGTTYAAVLGGEVKKDVYAGGRAGSMDNLFGAENFSDPGNAFVASANAYVLGGTARNVYGGGYLGHVGHHTGDISTGYSGDRPAKANVVIGKTGTNTFTGGAPAITRNVYGGGEGGSVYGDSKITINNGYIGYRYKNTGTEETPKYEYVEELDDKEPGDLDLSGNVFGGGYVINSYVDNTNINMYGGQVRGSLYGGGEIGPVGRGALKTGFATGVVNGDATIFKAGTTQVNMYNGNVLRNVFGGGRGKDSWGGDGTMYMDPTVVANLRANGMMTKGYIYGQTSVNIYGGEIGTDEGVAQGYGNVFGGGDEGFVYSAYELANGTLCIGEKPTDSKRYDKKEEGYYYKSKGSQTFVDNNGNELVDGAEKYLTEDCHVLVEPWLQLKEAVNYDGKDYAVGDYIPTSFLNTLPKKDKNATSWPVEWNSVDAGSVVDGKYVERGVIIHNAVFAGGNIAKGSEMHANTTTVYGNATASINDVYNRDLITVGGIHIGGLYGDGNMTFVDGYRELNVTNYGTDYYNIKESIDYSDYLLLPPREQAYYELKYTCLQECTDNEHTTYTPGTSVPQDELLVLFEGNNTIIVDGKPNPLYWAENGVVSRYAGRYLNTIQRADFCGVFGSRTVMKGAKDRVPEVEDGTNYTINRVREVSLNKKASVAGDVGEFATHGNYFGIYSVVNYLGALTSDLNFYTAERTTDNSDHKRYVDPTANGKAYGTATYADWKEQFYKDPRRNNGLSHNEVALASGVHLELTTEESTGNTLDTKVWGIITGVVQLDLINVAKGNGGGYVYAKNIHGKRQSSGKNHTILTDLNLHGGVDGARAVTNRIWSYVETDESVGDKTQKEWQTSGNFVHNTQTIIDDCYNVTGRYKMDDPLRVPAHYWYIRGTVYVYDQYITAHTGSSNAYTKNVELPITISAGARNKIKLLDVQPNLYAYRSSTGTPLGSEQKLLIQDNEYYLNTPISYWDWSLLTPSERNLFVKETYVTSDKCKIGNDIVSSDLVLLQSEYDNFLNNAEEVDLTPDDGKNNPVKAVLKIVKDEEGNDVVAKDKNNNPIYIPFESVFHSSNEMSHDKGYLLTYKMTNPKVWDTWYTQASSTTHAKQQADASGYDNGPTYYLNQETNMVLGQNEYKKSDIIPKNIYKDYQDLGTNKPTVNQAEFSRAYVVIKDYTSDAHNYYKGAPVSASVGASMGSTYAKEAYVCTGTIQLSPTEYIFINDLMTYDEKESLKTKYPSLTSDIEDLIVEAYYCTKEGLYGGKNYVAKNNYRALETWSSMSEADRAKFAFNYDAFDLLIDENYSGSEGQKYQYDNATTLEDAKKNFETYYTADDPEVIAEEKEVGDVKTPPGGYSVETQVDYTATYEKTTRLDLLSGQTVALSRKEIVEDVVKYNPVAAATYILEDDVLDREAYESLLNEQYHYVHIGVTDENKNTPFYVVKEPFYYQEPYAAGQLIDEKTYNALPHSTDGGLNYQKNVDKRNFSTTGDYYYCRDSYTIDSSYGTAVVDINDGSHAKNSTIDVGTIISATEYGKLKNQQKDFVIRGESPMETATLYVSRDASFDNLSTEKIITVIYQYDYEESDEDGNNIVPISERHVVRIHITFENGVPTVEDIKEPDIILPGTSLSMRVPGVTSNGYDIIGGGWELFETPEDAESHFNGKEYVQSQDSLYWYQDEFYIAYYTKTFDRGKTYSNHVPVHVANYHDLKKVMDDKKYHLHVDYDRTRLKRDSKIYINDYSGSSQNGLDLLKNLYDLSLRTTVAESGDLKDHALLNISEGTGTNIHDGTTNVKGVKGGKNLEFFLRTDIDHSTKPNPAYNPAVAEGPSNPKTIPAPWTSIGTDDQCFEGTLHGDGHTISGLDNSLFNNLCGNVYNLGVTGSFNTAGVVNKGTGYVESAWIKTTATEAAEGTKPYAVFGAPSDNKGYQVVNSYFCDGNSSLYQEVPAADDITYSKGSKGKVTAKSAQAFYNGELAYDLNNFYLYKRYNDGVGTSTGVDYKYWKQGEDGLESHTGYYASSAGHCSSGFVDVKLNAIKYVEERFADGDFRYAAGEIPTEDDERHWIDTEHNNKSYFFPIWPDDYIFFGQKLTYGWAAEAHQDLPSAIVRSDGRLSDGDDANRVYRAPAYYRSSEMGVAHFNPNAYLAQKSYDGTKTAYPGMTAIDFAGHNGANETNGEYKLGLAAAAGGLPQTFYPPLLDDDGLTGIENCDETQNLLVYAPAASGEGYTNAQTLGVLTSYFEDPVYDSHYDNTEGYRIVTEANPADVHGHLVQYDKTATNDHLLVDKQDFNAPIAYTFDGNHLMWYQRTSGNSEYVDHTKGWQGISVPFIAELVTTNQKGEITHFYSGSANSQNGTKIGHEYWLRQFEAITEDGDVARGTFNYPTAVGATKTVTNDFLWDYYYKNTKVHDQLDANADTYLQYRQYYKDSRNYPAYPLLQAATPYILGLPGKTYYEFDLSGNFEAQNTAARITKLGKQIITLASDKGISIGVSDNEMTGVMKTVSGTKNYSVTFKPSYMNMTLDDGNYVMNSVGDAYVKLDDTGTGKYITTGDTYANAAAFAAAGTLYKDADGTVAATSADYTAAPSALYYKQVRERTKNDDNNVTTSQSAFRPYFTATVTSSAKAIRGAFAKKIVFDGANGGFGEGPETVLDGSLEIYTRGYKIFTTSHMKEATTIRIANAAGATINNYVLQPGETIVTPVAVSGVYVVNKKKVFVE